MKVEKFSTIIPKNTPKQMEIMRQDALDDILAKNIDKFVNGEADAFLVTYKRQNFIQKTIEFIKNKFKK